MKHGTSVMYTKGRCRCEECRRHHVRYQKKWRVDREAGIEYTVPTDAIRAHVQQLLDQGMSFRGIALTAGWKSRNSLESALSRPRVRRATHDRIMAIRVDSDMRRFGYVDSTGSARRLQALCVLGWPARDLAVRIGGRDHGTVLDIAKQNNRTIRRDTAERIKALYDELWDQPGPSARSRTIALRKGWVPPLAWDDDTIDDPAAVPHVDGINRRSGRRPHEVVEDWHDTWDYHGGDLEVAATRLGMSRNTLEKNLARAREAGADVRTREVAA